jgi:signal transduction histidine kinase
LRFSTESLKPKAAEKKQTIHLTMVDALPNIVGNPVQIRQMVDNLIENAIKFTPPGGIISVRGELAQKQVILQVQDNGIGIPSIDLPYIFDKFYRASNASPDIVGSGLGLAIVKSIIDNHQGRIWVDSAVGIGTTFTIVLPLQQTPI